MPSNAIDSFIFKDMYGTDELRAVFSDEQLVQCWLDYEAALARAEAAVGLVPQEAAADRQAMHDLGVRSLLAVPVQVAGRDIGVFTLAAVRAHCDWPDELLGGVRLLAEVFATLHVRGQAQARERAAQAEAALWREQFAHVVRVHTVGEMSAALAHEITQPLGAIENYALAARRRAAGPAPELQKVSELLDRIVAQAARAGDVITRLRGLVRRHELQLVEIDLEHVAAACIELLHGECEQRGLRIELQAAGPLPPLVADEVHVQQVLLNLLRNALEAMDGAPPGAPPLSNVTTGNGSCSLRAMPARSSPIKLSEQLLSKSSTEGL